MLLVLQDIPNLATHIFIAHAYIFRIYFSMRMSPGLFAKHIP